VDTEAAEKQLLGLARRVQGANHARDEAELLIYLLTNRAVSLYHGFLHAMGGPSTSTPIIDARSLVELAIRLKWVTLDPPVNAILYYGSSEDADLKAIRALEQNLGFVPPAPLDAATVEVMKAQKAEIRDDAKALAVARGRRYGTRVMPDVEGMVREVESQDPAFATAMRQAYDDIYRAFSAWTHSEVMSFKHFVRENGDGTATYLGDGWGIAPEHVRVVAASTFALVLEVVGSGRDEKLAREARAARERLTQPR
jgi:hypothetical protein